MSEAIITVAPGKAIFSKKCNCCGSGEDVQAVELGRKYDEKSSNSTVVCMCHNCRVLLYAALGPTL